MAEAQTAKANRTEVMDTLSYLWGYRLNTMILAVHVALLLIFFVSGATAMAVVNCFSVTCYFLEYIVLKHNPTIFLRVFIVEVLVHATLAIYFVGWDCGFQYYAFGLVAILAFCDHTLLRDGFASATPLLFSAISVVDFLLCTQIGSRLTPVYELKPVVVSDLAMANGVMIMLLIVVFSKVYIDRILSIESELTQNAEFDELTGLPNRHRLDRILDEQQIGKMGGPKEYAVAILDLDDFKKVNDRFGHLAGDQVLKKLATILKSIETENVFVARWGGEEFIALVRGENAYSALTELMEMVRKQVEGTVVFFENWRLRETVSIGVSGTINALVFKELVEEADTCLYEAKGNGKNQVVGKKG